MREIGDVAGTGIRPEVIEEIMHIAIKYDVKKVILFGSRARGDFWRASDIDLAVSGGDFNKFCLEVDQNTDTLLKYDIVNLDGELSPGFYKNIYQDGVVIYEEI